MANSSSRAPKQWQLTRSETINSFNNWKENLIYTLSLDANFSPYTTKDDASWGKKTTASPHRGFVDDNATTAGAKTKEQKCANVDLMLGQIANYATLSPETKLRKTPPA